MIYCPQCGNPNFDDANYCDTCGEPLINADEYAKMRNAAEMQQLLEAQRQQREAAAYNKAYRKAQKEAKKAAKAQGGEAAGAAANNTPQGVHGAGVAGAAAAGAAAGVASVPGDFTVYKHGCLAQAWDDITESEGWAKRILTLGIINMVPILNFFVSGFAMKWARQLPLDKVDGMPTKVLQDGSFLQGFYACLIYLIVGIVAAVVSGILGIIPWFGALLGIAVSLFLSMFSYLAVMRVSIAESLGPGFDVKAICKAIFTNRFGKLFCATVLPGIIVGAASAFICGSVLVVFGMNSIMSLVENIQYAQQMQLQIQEYNAMIEQNPMLGMFADPMLSMGAYSDPWPAVISQAMGLVPLFFILYLIAMFLSALSVVLSLRATAHYVTRYNHDWSTLVLAPAQQQAQAAQRQGQAVQQAQPAQQQAQPVQQAQAAHPAQTDVSQSVDTEDSQQ